MIDMKATGEQINKLIRNNNFTREGIAISLRISQTAVYKWLRGESVPSIDNLIMLTKLFNCKIDDLIVLKE